MQRTRDFLAVDLGASSGRVLAGRWDGSRFTLQEVHRFANEPVSQMGRLQWDVLALWSQVRGGLARYAAWEPVEESMESATTRRGELAGLGLDTWGVDFALLDRVGNLLGNPHHYRDRRTIGAMARAFERVPRHDVFVATGAQPMAYNTLYQLLAMVRARDPQLDVATTMLPMPNLFSYWLTGQRVAERTHATTTQCLRADTGAWATGLLERLGIPTQFLPPLVEPGTLLGPTLADVTAETGLPAAPVFAVASHDTASAVAAIPSLDGDSAYISSGTWSLIGVEIATPLITDAVLSTGLLDHLIRTYPAARITVSAGIVNSEPSIRVALRWP